MYHVSLYEQIRRACKVEGKSQREAAQQYGVSRWMVRKMLKHYKPPGNCRKQKVAHRLMDDYAQVVADIIETDKTAPRKQKHTSRRIYDLLVSDHDFKGNYSTVTRYMGKQRGRNQEVYIPLVHVDGTACYDFGEAYAVLDGVSTKIHFAVMDCCRTDQIFVKAYVRENTQAFQDSHAEAFSFFGGVPSEILYDNTGIAVVMKGGSECRKETPAFTQLKSYYLFTSQFCAPGKGNEKGKVENKVGYTRRNFLTPVPVAKTLAELNAYLLQCCEKHRDKMRLKMGEDAFTEEKAAFLSLPQDKFSAVHITCRKATKMSLVRYGSNDYSVPTEHAFKEVTVKAYYHRIDVCYQNQVIATHERSYAKGEQILSPYHYLDLIKRKIRSIDQAAPLKQLQVPACFDKYHKRLREAHHKKGDREFIDVLKLLEVYSLSEVTQAVQKSLATGSTECHTVKQHILNQKHGTGSTVKKDDSYAHLPALNILAPDLAQYDALRGVQ